MTSDSLQNQETTSKASTTKKKPVPSTKKTPQAKSSKSQISDNNEDGNLTSPRRAKVDSK